MTGLLNAMTVDVEEYFQVSAFESVVSRDDWKNRPSRVEDSVARVLDLFDRAEIRATFFVLGWVAESHPGVVKRIAGGGHEIASHGFSHRLAYDQQPAEFRRETEQSRRVLQDLSGQPVVGYRAASFSIGRRNLWALDILAEVGFTYDSSLFPVVHDRYGLPGAPRQIHRLRTPGGLTLTEVPPSTVVVARMTLPVAGGGYLRMLPLAITKWAVKRLNAKEGAPAIVYVHPWELDPEQPRIRGSLLSRMRHYTGLNSTEGKLADLLGRFRFGTVLEVIDDTFRREPSEVSEVKECAGQP